MDLNGAMRRAALETLKDLGPKARNGELTQDEEARWAVAEGVVEADAPVPAAARSIFDLPMAKGMWAADGRSVER